MKFKEMTVHTPILKTPKTFKSSAFPSNKYFSVGNANMASSKMASSKAAINLSTLVLGVCLPSLKHNASKFKVQYLLFDKFLKKHFRHSIEVVAYDPDKICKSGDIALLQEMPENMSKAIKHRVLEVVYPMGDLTDPITGNKIASGMLRDDWETIWSLYGKLNSGFDYDKAPRRGWQEDKRDFTHRPSYIKYHEFNEEDENREQPYAVHT